MKKNKGKVILCLIVALLILPLIVACSCSKKTSGKDVLIIDGNNQSAELRSLMDSQFGLKYDWTTLEDAPTTEAQLKKYDEVIMMDVDRARMPGGLESALYKYVTDFGGGLFTTGGEYAYNPEDMSSGDFAKLLPVNIEEYAPPMAVYILLDNSDVIENMYDVPWEMMPGDYADMARQFIGERTSVGNVFRNALLWGALGTIGGEYLRETDYMGLITIGEGATKRTPMGYNGVLPSQTTQGLIATTAGGPTGNIMSKIQPAFTSLPKPATLAQPATPTSPAVPAKPADSNYISNGNPDIKSALTMAHQDFLKLTASVALKQIVIISDGNTSQTMADYGNIIEQCKEDGITISTVVMQAEDDVERGIVHVPADSAKMKAIADAASPTGEGICLNTTSLNPEENADVTQIVELIMGGNVKLDADPYTPTVTGPLTSSIYEGVSTVNLPKLTGYHGNKLKSGADKMLEGAFGLPLYAQWTVGNGRVGSFMCDLKNTSDSGSYGFLANPQGNVEGQKLIKNIINYLKKK